jgi:hypothetical protein
MFRAVLFLLLTALMALPQVHAQTKTDKSETVFAVAPDILIDAEELRKLKKEISDASPEQFFAVHLVFDKPVTVEDVHAAALQLRIPRVLAYIEYGPLFVDRPRSSLILGLGEMYAGEVARRHTRCRAMISISYGEENELRDQPTEAWIVSKIQVYGTAHAIRELQTGSILTAATVVDGQSAKLEHVQKLATYTREEVSKKIELPANYDAPEQCVQTVASIDAPVLAAGFDPSLNKLPPLADEGFREYAFRVLATLPPDSAVTIRLKLDFPATVDVLASLVWQYGIEGMSAELVPERSDKRVIATPELSIHGESLGDQVKRARCQMRLGNGPQTKSEWYADWVSVSMPLNKAWVFLSYPRFSQAKIVGRFPRGDLERLVSYFERRSEKVYEMPEWFIIPPDCGDYYKHP